MSLVPPPQNEEETQLLSWWRSARGSGHPQRGLIDRKEKKAEELRHWGKIVWKKIHLRKKNVDRNGYIWMASMYSSHQTKLTANTWDTSVSDESLLAEELWLYLRAYYLVLGVLLAQRNLHLGFSVNFNTDRCLKGVKFPWSEDDGGWIQSPRLIIFPYFFPFLLLFFKIWVISG